MQSDSLEKAGAGRTVSRRWLLRSTASLTAGVAAAGSVTFASTETKPEDPVIEPDHDPVTGEIFDRDRHHYWDTV